MCVPVLRYTRLPLVHTSTCCRRPSLRLTVGRMSRGTSLFQSGICKAPNPSLPHSESHPIDSHFHPCVVISIGGRPWRVGVTHLLKRK